ncbi:UvrB/UvrC motif-containing protein [Streptomyces sp. NPDC091215]|uniref:UvrB/UvrC motif-containing protein n=1 Tax=Streptomyces sp. NPDC091215 TaxID=3155192 RepID=UPI0034308CBF
MATLTTADIRTQLEQAQRSAGELGTELARLTGEMDQAVEAKDYKRAAQLKQQADELRPRAMLAQSQVQALQQTLDGLQEHHRQENAAEIERERMERYEAVRAQHVAAEQEALAESQRLLEQTKADIATAGESLQAALAAEARAYQARQDAYQAAVEAGLEQPSVYGPAAPNWVRARVDADQLLAALLRRTA